MLCKNCGNQLAGDVRVCPKCGVEIGGGGGTTSSAGKSPSPSTDDSGSLVSRVTGLLKPAVVLPRTAEIEALAAGPAKSLKVYILLALFLGNLGAHSFYAGYRRRALTALMCAIPPCCCLLTIFPAVGAIQDMIHTRCDAAGRPMI